MTPTTPKVIVLLGAPGSGKSAVARVLRDRFGWRWTDREAGLVERWGDTFAENKPRALRELHDEIRSEIALGGPVLVHESTGLSEGAFVDELVVGGAIVVRLEVTRDVALSRIAVRIPGEHLTDDLDRSAAVWDAFAATPRDADLTCDTELLSAEEIAERIFAFV
jgi:shikimate kinase